jgi:hypothetical protein
LGVRAAVRPADEREQWEGGTGDPGKSDQGLTESDHVARQEAESGPGGEGGPDASREPVDAREHRQSSVRKEYGFRQVFASASTSSSGSVSVGARG